MREDRRHPTATDSDETDTRTSAQKDRDRVIYTSAFRRLAGVTQVVGAFEGHAFHNRLTHTLEVAQIARRLAERVIAKQGADLARHGIAIDPDVVEAAALAHDLGHPPFGHVAEEALNRCVDSAAPQADGYEGNAQSFRILVRLAAQKPPHRGLNLTRATLNAVLKYPWVRGEGRPDKPTKFGAYRGDRLDFTFARVGFSPQAPSLEAQIMDHADAVAYSVHDFDDFYRAGLLPLEDVHSGIEREINEFRAGRKVATDFIDERRNDLKRWFGLMPRGRYTGDYNQRAALRALNSSLIGEFVGSVRIVEREDTLKLDVSAETDLRIRFLQNIVWRHVIMSPRLATQQHGQRRIIETLFQSYRDAINDPKEAGRLVPGAFRRELELLDEPPADGATSRGDRIARLAADIVASLTDSQASAVFRRITGVATGSVTDLLDG